MRRLRCRRCGHRWYPRKPTPPARCPACGVVRWRQAKAAQPASTEPTPGAGGPPDRKGPDEPDPVLALADPYVREALDDWRRRWARFYT